MPARADERVPTSGFAPAARMGRLAIVIVSLMFGPTFWAAGLASAQTLAPDVLITKLSASVLDALRADPSIQAGDVGKVLGLVDAKVMPHVDARRMTSSALGRFWRKASPAQRTRLQQEFTQLVLRTYAGALTQVNDQTIRVRPLRAAPVDRQVVVRTEVRGGRTPVRLDYRLTKTPAGWKIFDVNVLGVWLTQNYRNSFASEIRRSGIDGLIEKLAQKNRTRRAR